MAIVFAEEKKEKELHEKLGQILKKEGAIKEIAESLNSARKLVDKDKFIADVLEREELGSTGIGSNVGIPHARTGAVKGFVIGFGKSKEGIEFKSLDGEKVNLVFLMGADPGELNLYLRIEKLRALFLLMQKLLFSFLDNHINQRRNHQLKRLQEQKDFVL